MLTLSNLTIYSEDGVIKNGSLVIEQGLIQKIQEKNAKDQSGKGKLIAFPDDCILVPGFIDLHVHGAAGCDVMDGSVEALSNISQALAKEGTTHFLATTMTASPEAIAQVVSVAAQFIQQTEKQPSTGASLLGIHLEGPFLSPKKVGAQRADFILHPKKELMQEWQRLAKNHIKLITLAPELSGSRELIEFLKTQKCIVSIGHTDATYAETRAAIDAGCSYATHLFNAMRGIHHREPGAVTAALLADEVMGELIVDGHHLHPEIVNLALKLKGIHNLVLVTDAMRAKCLKDGSYDLGGQSVQVKQDVARLEDGTLAGSVLTMNLALKNLINFTGCSIEDALHLTSINPAKKLGILNKTGSIATGKQADLVVLDKAFKVVLTVHRGECIYQSKLGQTEVIL